MQLNAELGKSITLRVTTVIRCTMAVAAIMPYSMMVPELLCMSRAHFRRVDTFIGSTA